MCLFRARGCSRIGVSVSMSVRTPKALCQNFCFFGIAVHLGFFERNVPHVRVQLRMNEGVLFVEIIGRLSCNHGLEVCFDLAGHLVEDVLEFLLGRVDQASTCFVDLCGICRKEGPIFDSGGESGNISCLDSFT